MGGRKRRWQASVLFVGSSVGAGVFGLPYVFAQVGWPVGVLFLVLVGGLLLTLQLMYAEIALQTPGRSRISGLAGQYLGPWGRWLAFCCFFVAMSGVLLAYLLLGSTFLSTLIGFSGWIPFLIFFVLASLLVMVPLKRAAQAECFVWVLLLLFFAFVLLAGLPEARLENLTNISNASWWLPYGVVLFALSNSGAVPEMHAFLGRRYEHELPKSIMIAYTVLFLLYALFTAGIVAVSGTNTTPDAITGYANAISPVIGIAGSFLGLLTVLSAFGMIGQQMKDTLHEDLRISIPVSTIATLAIPLVLFLGGARSLIDTLAFTGAVGSALLAFIVLLTYEAMYLKVCKKAKCLRVPRPLSLVLALLFVGGAVHALITLL